MSEAENYADKNIPVILIGNKSDCERVVLKEKGKSFATSKGYDFEEVSAKTSDKVFDTIKNFGGKVAKLKDSNTKSLN